MNTKPEQARGGPVPAMADSVAVAPRRSSRWFRLTIFTVFFGLLGFLGLMMLAGWGRHRVSTHALDIKHASDLMHELRSLDENSRAKRDQREPQLTGLAGGKLWAALFDMQIVRNPRKLFSAQGADEEFFMDHFEEMGPMPAMAISYTAPKIDELADLSGKPGAVLICYNARNWNNFPKYGVLVVWADSEVAQWMTEEEARRYWGITAEEWADPAGKLFGKKAPFQHTYE